uniref:Uncharacterized protein n=1 Tax=viral metagenome TaxID=1070528 RepID=A0A6C0D3F9_9ZZZZ
MDQRQETDPRYFRYIRTVHQFDAKRGNREVFIHIPFSHQFLRDIPNDSAKHRVIADSLSFLKDYFLETLHLPVKITPVIPFPFHDQKAKKELIGLKISGSRRHVHDIEKYLTRHDVMKFIQQTRRYHKQLEHQRQQQKITAMANKALESSTLQKPFSSSIQPYPHLFFPDQQQRKQYEMWSSPSSPPTLSTKQQKQDW